MFEDKFVMELSNGIKLYENQLTKNIIDYANKKGLDKIRCYKAEHLDGLCEYLILQDTTPIYTSQNYESIATHIDIMALRLITKKQKGEIP